MLDRSTKSALTACPGWGASAMRESYIPCATQLKPAVCLHAREGSNSDVSV